MRSSFDISPRQYKWQRLNNLISCGRCPLHRGENTKHRNRRPIKKQWQLDKKRRKKIVDKSVVV